MTTATLTEQITSRLKAGQTPLAAAEALGLDYEDAVLLPGWHASDGNADVYYPDAESGEAAANQYVGDGDWASATKTWWCIVSTWRTALLLEDGEIIEDRIYEDSCGIAVEPDEPSCIDDGEHAWRAPHSIVGGLTDNPGVWGHGGGVVCEEVCVSCGCGRTTDTWAQAGGIQGLESVEYTAEKYDIEAELNRRAEAGDYDTEIVAVGNERISLIKGSWGWGASSTARRPTPRRRISTGTATRRMLASLPPTRLRKPWTAQPPKSGSGELGASPGAHHGAHFPHHRRPIMTTTATEITIRDLATASASGSRNWLLLDPRVPSISVFSVVGAGQPISQYRGITVALGNIPSSVVEDSLREWLEAEAQQEAMAAIVAAYQGADRTAHGQVYGAWDPIVYDWISDFRETLLVALQGEIARRWDAGEWVDPAADEVVAEWLDAGPEGETDYVRAEIERAASDGVVLDSKNLRGALRYAAEQMLVDLTDEDDEQLDEDQVQMRSALADRLARRAPRSRS